MRIPVPIVIISCLLTIVAVWLIGTHDKNFTDPPTPEDLVQIAKDWEENKPDIPASHFHGGQRQATPEIAKPLPSTITQSRELQKLPEIDFSQSPALSEYGTLGQQDDSLLVRLATHLETQGRYQHALLAWERVIDTGNPTVAQRQQAIAAIKRLKSTLPPWNPDPVNDIALTLHAGATLKQRQNLESALGTVAEIISVSSGSVIAVNTQATIGKGRGVQAPLIPVAIWFSRPGKSPAETRAETPPISFMANPDQEDALTGQIAAGAYSLVRAHLARETSFSHLPESPETANPEDLIKYHITRLMWREFVNGLRE